MSFRKKLVLIFALTVLICVAVISASLWNSMQRSFDRANDDRAKAVASQFRSEFQHRGEDVVRKVEAVAASEVVQRIALEVNRGASDSGNYVGEARNQAGQQHLDFLELVDHQGAILSSAQWQAKFGYPEPAIPWAIGSAGAFLKREELSSGSTLGLFAVRAAGGGEQPLYLIGGGRLEQGIFSPLGNPGGAGGFLF